MFANASTMARNSLTHPTAPPRAVHSDLFAVEPRRTTAAHFPSSAPTAEKVSHTAITASPLKVRPIVFPA
jgi:hypothetical protein